MASLVTDLPTLQAAWRTNLASLPSTPDNIPAFFFGHGSPGLARISDSMSRFGDAATWMGPTGPLAHFLKDFGPALLEKYKPKAIVVFSAHWETEGERLVSDYGDENPLLMDYYGFDREYYELQFKSRGDTAIAKRVVELFTKAGYLARTTPKTEPRGRDGRGFLGPGLDHGVFIPFRIMFSESFTDIPIIATSIDGSLSPTGNWNLGKAVAQLRKEGVLVLSGGLTVHNLRDFTGFSPFNAKESVKDFDREIVKAVQIEDLEKRKEAMVNLTKHRGFREAHPREDHFVPLYVAAGAGEDGKPKIITDMYAAETVAFGL